jgi:hypothetical protein
LGDLALIFGQEGRWGSRQRCPARIPAANMLFVLSAGLNGRAPKAGPGGAALRASKARGRLGSAAISKLADRAGRGDMARRAGCKAANERSIGASRQRGAAGSRGGLDSSGVSNVAPARWRAIRLPRWCRGSRERRDRETGWNRIGVSEVATAGAGQRQNSATAELTGAAAVGCSDLLDGNILICL